MSEIDPECLRKDILDTVRLLGGAPAIAIAARSGYQVAHTSTALADLEKAGLVVRLGGPRTAKWVVR